jgi:predicted metal-binding membrane protein
MDVTSQRFGSTLLGSASAWLLLLAAVAWATVFAISRGMGAMSGTMGLDVVAFVGVWTLMMAAMMLPGVTPFASLYTRTLTEHRGRRMVAFVSGYLLVWAMIGLPAFGLAWVADRLVTDHAPAATMLAALVFVSCGVYQLTPLKDRCLALCRSPLGFTVKYGAYRGRGRDVRAGVFHGAFCAGCCWALMLVLLAFGLMNVAAMVAVAAVVVIEKAWRRGTGFARVVGVAALVLAAIVIVDPAIVPGLHSTRSPTMKGTM